MGPVTNTSRWQWPNQAHTSGNRNAAVHQKLVKAKTITEGSLTRNQCERYFDKPMAR
jgi:hypothetical protein